ncbi:dual specificity protein phosphatase 14-like [Paramacrobiotus metropolitanus]|uniref:dual specificity protein phosphatase 14-like n=1 Tax=Paramacrobiotus metropolitanus TaxID=2943436 RepID=UPI0024460C1A|nr:dual specificity protein phosphatase 14-like [Paramacrobiotus metropolitanus]
MVDRFGRVHQIVDFLYLSGANGARRDHIRERGITCVINCTIELSNLPLTNVEFINVKVDDSPYASIIRYFDSCADKIEEHRLAGGKVLVHCMAGVSRSASIVIAYLVKYQNLSLKEAYAAVRAARSIIRPNPGFWKQLIEYEYRIRKEESVRMVPSAFGMIPDVYESEMKPMGWLKVKTTFRL